ncbi:hypothetical protein Bca52824_013522 [Brassica carinata]|uniref:Uncharacterized protein n=1 Tax=Brassica carinata TaxID=52824 RepID=A0A8X7VYE9_BRACI|nr:hypothetical protein Bca52824_013522 [Brassica carinata]
MNVQAAILQFDEVASTLSLVDLHPEERDAIEEAVMAMSNALRVGDWYETPTTNKRRRREEKTEWSE